MIDLSRKFDLHIVKKAIFEILSSLSFLSSIGINGIQLCPEMIFIHSDSVKLLHYGMNYITDYGRLVDFPIGNPRYIAPEYFLYPSNCKIKSINQVLYFLSFRWIYGL
jgi:serine/threonine protein kinase